MKLLFISLFFISLFISLTTKALEPGELSPEVSLLSFNNGIISNLSDYQGKLIYIDFWASWCGPCKKSFPFMEQLHQDFATKGLQIVAINMDENRADAETFLKNYPAEFRLYTGNAEVAKKFDVSGLPIGYLIDRNGVVVARHIGFSDKKSKKLIAQITFLLAQ
jgi:thiol-disulfide isomerase/thioredoxin